MVADTAPGLHCDGCGRPSTACAGCRWEFDPPHFCTTCGTRLAVSVTPTGWHARCKHHGPVEPDDGGPPAS